MARARRRKCPQCRSAFTSAGLSDTPSFPFCTEKCKLLDLGTWLSDGYAVVEDLSRGQDMKQGLADPKTITDPKTIADPDVRAALEELENN